MIDALHGKTGMMATMADLYSTKAALVIGTDLAQEHPLIAFQLRANWRHHKAHVYTVTPGKVREDDYATSVRAAEGGEFEALETLRDKLKAEPELVILFGDTIKGPLIRQLVSFGDSLGIPVKFVCLVDYSNSRGASDMGLLPDLLPGYYPVSEGGLQPGLNYFGMLTATDLDAFWVVGANPLARYKMASPNAFIVVQDMFLTETARKANVVLPAASAYEKNGTVTNVTGEVQKLTRAAKTMGAKTDLEIISLIARDMRVDLGSSKPEVIFQEIRRVVRGYDVPTEAIETGGAAATVPLNGRVEYTPRPEMVQSARNTLFTSGTLGRYSKMLGAVLESPGRLYEDPAQAEEETVTRQR
jgi:NADH-quinone oxidoreductase subunit G